ncbi:hypothetical protein [Halomonas sp. 18071143]|uniref:hypothetical protein n=1 Tax=Halomonas sp. 18071143 TaxID=2855441 RepID=UPI001C446A30|nr:hypothetical protein [Halomonas sp. 18071143]
MLANVYLHYVLDEWFEQDVKPRLRGRAFSVRFADDAVLAFSNEADARKVLEVLAKRFARFGLPCTRPRLGWYGFGHIASYGPRPSTSWALPITGGSPCVDAGSSSRKRPRTGSSEA